MQTRYTKTLRYDCQRHALDYGAPACQSLVGEPLEQLVAAQILQVVTPASLDLSRRAAQECERERSALDRHWRLRLERARQEADRAARQYHAVEPENRLVARTLERQWEEALRAQRTLEEEYHRFQQTQPTQLSAAERARIETLAQDLPALWQSPQTAVLDKRQVVRLLVQRVVVWAPAASQEVRVEVHWTGGTRTEHQVTRPVAGWQQVRELATVLAQVRQWQGSSWTSQRMATALNALGHRTPRGKCFTATTVRQLLARTGPGRDASQPQRKSSKPR
jgi:hypothetical protein